MKKEDFENRMEDWAQKESENAPKLQPTAEMIRLVQAKGKSREVRFPWLRWSHVGIALAALILLLTTYLTLYKPNFLFQSSPQAIAFVSQREVPIAEVPIETLEAISPVQGKGRGQASYQVLEFQVYRRLQNKIETFDLRQELTQPLDLTYQDSYRILIKANQARLLYLYLLSPSGEFQALHSQAAFEPLTVGEKVYRPPKPGWFYLRGEPGPYQLFAISSPNHLSQLESLYDQYTTARDAETTADALRSSLLRIKAASPAEVEAWSLIFTLE